MNSPFTYIVSYIRVFEYLSMDHDQYDHNRTYSYMYIRSISYRVQSKSTYYYEYYSSTWNIIPTYEYNYVCMYSYVPHHNTAKNIPSKIPYIGVSVILVHTGTWNESNSSRGIVQSVRASRRVASSQRQRPPRRRRNATYVVRTTYLHTTSTYLLPSSTYIRSTYSYNRSTTSTSPRDVPTSTTT